MRNNYLESDMVASLAKALPKLFSTDTSFREFSTGYGIADLVFAVDFEFKKNSFDRFPINNYYALRIFLELRDDTQYALPELQKTYSYLPTSQLKRILDYLSLHGYLTKSDKSSWEKCAPSGPFNPIKKIIAIEAKLTDYKAGLMQARRYQYFADESYLALLKSSSQKVPVDELKTGNIGLIVFDEHSGEIEIKHRPSKSTGLQQSALNLLAKELLITKYVEQFT
jgi:hypothetical protein